MGAATNSDEGQLLLSGLDGSTFDKASSAGRCKSVDRISSHFFPPLPFVPENYLPPTFRRLGKLGSPCSTITAS